MNDFVDEKNFMIDVIKEAASKFLCAKPTDIAKKGQFDLVTKADTDIESYIVRKIHDFYSGDSVIGEEYTPEMLVKADRCWTIDPIDGTVNYAHGSSEYGIQCSLITSGKIQVSVIFIPTKKETFWAIRGNGAFCNDCRIKIDPQLHISDSVVYMGDFSHKKDSTRKIQLNSVNYLSSRVSKIRMVGAACIDFSSIASGRADGLISITQNPWDIYPGLLLCQEAGAVVTDLSGNEYKFGADGVIAASSRELSLELINSMKSNNTM